MKTDRERLRSMAAIELKWCEMASDEMRTYMTGKFEKYEPVECSVYFAARRAGTHALNFLTIRSMIDFEFSYLALKAQAAAGHLPKVSFD